MKHLKTYSDQEFLSSTKCVELPQQMIDEIEDICLELTDKGFTFGINKYGPVPSRTRFFSIQIWKDTHINDGDFIYTYEISEVMSRIKDYVNMSDFAAQVYGQIETGNYKSEIKIGESYCILAIFFTKKFN